MAFKRVEGRIDINYEIENRNIVVNEEEQRGTRTNKFWFNNYEYMYKDVYQLTYEDYAEIIAYKLAEQVGINCAKYDLAIFNGNKGVITENLIKDNENEEMISGTEIISMVYTEYFIPRLYIIEKYHELITQYNAKNIYEFSNLSNDKQLELRNKLLSLIEEVTNKKIEYSNNKINYPEIEEIYEYFDNISESYNPDFIEMKNGIIKANNLYDIWNVLEIYAKTNNLDYNIEEIMNNLINMFIFDIITSQGDRHADNWSIIKNNKDNSIRLCPLYDNSGICDLNREKGMKSILEYIQSLNNPTLHEKKKHKIQKLLETTINHSNSGLKVDKIDVNKKNKNIIMMEKFIDYSSQEFIERIIYMTKKLDKETLDFIFLEIEKEIQAKIPEEVKIVVKTVINTNIEMIREICSEKGITK